MNSQQLLFINLIIIVLIALYFILKRAKQGQSSINVQGDPPPKALTDLAANSTYQSLPDKSEIKPKSDVYFVYNGHEWSALEVLSIQKTANLEEITVQYQVLIKNSDPSTFDFYEAAYQALLKHHRSASGQIN